MVLKFICSANVDFSLVIDIVQMATERENIEPEYRTRTIESLSRHIEAALRLAHLLISFQ
jgi:hypothetical protein